MKLAEALIIRTDLQKRIAQLKGRLKRNAKVQSGDTPAEDPKSLIRELADTTASFIEIVATINKTNALTLVEGKSIADMLTERDAKTTQVTMLREFLQEASEKVDRYSNKEIAILSTVNVAEQQKEIDNLSKYIRELDTKIQQLNWLTDTL